MIATTNWKNMKNYGSITNNSENYYKKHMKIKFNPDNVATLNKMLKLYNMAIVVGSVLHEGNNITHQFS